MADGAIPRRALALMATVLALALLLLAADGRPSLALPGITERVSVASDGSQGDEDSDSPTISADGRYVAFRSSAANLVDGVTVHAAPILVHDRQTGLTELVSVDSAGNQGNRFSEFPTISADGRYVAFHSRATNLVDDDTNDAGDIFVHDRQTGITERVSVDSAGNQGNDVSYQSAISADGRYVAFDSLASNLVAGDTNGTTDVFVHDRQTGLTERVSVESAGNQGNAYSFWPAISADGRYVAFESGASNLVVGDTALCGPPSYTHHCQDIFVHDRQTGLNELVSVDSAGNQGNDTSSQAAISADGRYVAFESWASNLVPGDTNGTTDVFVHDRQTGLNELVSVDSAGNQGHTYSSSPAISADGRHVTFSSAASNLVPGDTNSSGDVFVHDRQTGITERVSVDSGDNQADGASSSSVISADGRYVAFQSDAFNLVPGETLCASDIFVHDRLGIPEQGAVSNCPQPGKWAMSVWEGPDGTETDQALATCADGAATAYYIDPDTQVWSRWFAGRPDISNLAILEGMQAVIALGAPPTPRPCPTAIPTPTPMPTPAETPYVQAAANGDTSGVSDVSAHARRGMLIADVAESAHASDSSAPSYIALAGLAAVAVMALAAGAWYARRRWLL